MSTSAHVMLETEAPVFDVIVTINPGVKPADIQRLALQYGELSKGQIEGLMKAFQNGPRVKVGDHVPKDRADKAKEQFGKLGLTVTVVPQLSLQVKPEGDFDGRFLCRACNTRVDLPANRQCPSCEMFVDKITDEWLLKRKITEQERAKLDSRFSREDQQMKKANQKSLEDAIRAKIREELEEEYGVKEEKGLFQGQRGLLRAGGLLGLVAVAFVGGGMIPPGSLPWTKGSQAVTKSSVSATPNATAMLDSVAPVGGAGEPQSGAGGDADLDDPMIQALAGGKKMGGPGISMEQAIAASRGLAASVGNTTFDKATGGNGALAPGGTAVDESPVTVTPLTKHLLAAEFARNMASIGQWRRASAIVKALKSLAVEPAAVVAVQSADLEAQAWAMADLSAGGARQAMDVLIRDAQSITDAADRARALGQVATIISGHAQLSPDAARAFLKLADESLKSVGDAKLRASAGGDWMVAAGHVLANEAIAHAKAGRLAKVQAAAEQLQGLTQETSDPTVQSRLHAFGYQIHVAMGLQEKADQKLGAALTAASQVADIVEHTALLRKVAQIAGGVTLAPLQAHIDALKIQIELKPALSKELAYAHLSLTYADYGVRDKADENRRLALATKGMTAVESGAVQANLLARSEMATAKFLHLGGRYAESELILQRLSGYLM
jgi:hypothetical protein